MLKNMSLFCMVYCLGRVSAHGGSLASMISVQTSDSRVQMWMISSFVVLAYTSQANMVTSNRCIKVDFDDARRGRRPGYKPTILLCIGSTTFHAFVEL